MLVYALRPRTVLEIGTFSGYSTLALAEALPPVGRIISCEIDPPHAATARRHVAASPWRDRIDVVVGDALETVARLDGPFDFVFVDGDKADYAACLDAVLPKLGEHAIVAVDNTLHLGGVAKDTDVSPDVQAVRSFNEKVRDDPRLEQVVLTVRDGVTLIRRRS
jgi:caffeoyl-CoA O-methyltransferase